MGFWDRMEEVVNEGLKTSREVVSKAKDKARDLGEKGMLRYEIMQLDRQAEKTFVRLGVQVYERLVTGGQDAVSRDEVKDLLEEIGDLRRRVEGKEKELREAR